MEDLEMQLHATVKDSVSMLLATYNVPCPSTNLLVLFVLDIEQSDSLEDLEEVITYCCQALGLGHVIPCLSTTFLMQFLAAIRSAVG